MTTVVSQDLLPVVVRQDTAVVVTRESGETVVVRQSAAPAVVVTRGIPGPAGPLGPPGPAGGATLIPVGATPLSGHSAVALGADGALQPADCTLAAHRGAVLGVVANAYAAGADAVVSNNIPLEHAGWTWAVGPVFLGAAGVLTQVLPAGAKFSQVVGHAVSATRVLIDVQPPINIA